jgi:hypothetical protein
MFATDCEIVGGQDDVAVGISSEDGAILLEHNALLRIVPFQDEQISHRITSGAGGRLIEPLHGAWYRKARVAGRFSQF